MFKECNEIGDSDILIIIEHCTNCHQHQSNTRHIQEKYHLYAKTIKQAIISRYPMVKVNCKPITSSTEQYKAQIYLNRKKPEPNSLNLDKYRPEMRIGAFEVQLFSKRGNAILHSKLASRMWPNVKTILDKIADYIPHTQINVEVYSTSNENKPLNGLKYNFCLL